MGSQASITGPWWWPPRGYVKSSRAGILHIYHIVHSLKILYKERYIDWFPGNMDARRLRTVDSLGVYREGSVFSADRLLSSSAPYCNTDARVLTVFFILLSTQHV